MWWFARAGSSGTRTSGGQHSRVRRPLCERAAGRMRMARERERERVEEGERMIYSFGLSARRVNVKGSSGYSQSAGKVNWRPLSKQTRT